jgi:FkbM family methyltransferase
MTPDFFHRHKYFGPSMRSKEGVQFLISTIFSRLSRRTVPVEIQCPSKRSFSQCGEDAIIDAYFSDRGVNCGFYIDIGAMHPYRFSNTAILSELGWSGVCIEPNPTLASLHEKYRPNAKVVQEAVDSSAGTLDLIVFPGHDALSTVNPEYAHVQEKLFNTGPTSKLQVNCRSLADILGSLDVPDVIHFMDVDVEGHDLIVLRSNDWDRFRPEVILVEVKNDESEIGNLLESQGYREYAHVSANKVYVRSE